jgi:hypothetical protein
MGIVGIGLRAPGLSAQPLASAGEAMTSWREAVELLASARVAVPVAGNRPCAAAQETERCNDRRRSAPPR